MYTCTHTCMPSKILASTKFIGASVSEPHTGESALHIGVYGAVCLDHGPTAYHRFQKSGRLNFCLNNATSQISLSALMPMEILSVTVSEWLCVKWEESYYQSAVSAWGDRQYNLLTLVPQCTTLPCIYVTPVVNSNTHAHAHTHTHTHTTHTHTHTYTHKHIHTRTHTNTCTYHKIDHTVFLDYYVAMYIFGMCTIDALIILSNSVSNSKSQTNNFQ